MNHVWEDQMRKTLSLMTGIAAAAVMSSATAAYADCGEVSLTEMNWPSSLLMEQRPVMH
jgi:glycine betaine/proline transport system substrate-binding protein